MPRKKAFALRVSDDIFAAIQRWADDDLRSVNGQIEFLLREALRDSGRIPPPKADPAPGTKTPDDGDG
ncbi:MAG: Arc family DNA binding domain-containing protein [Pseudomonadota bacterium]